MDRKQYTIRNIPPEVDSVLREESAKYGKSLNTLVVEKLAESCGVEPARKTNGLERFAGIWVDDPEFDNAIAEFEKIDLLDWPELKIEE